VQDPTKKLSFGDATDAALAAAEGKKSKPLDDGPEVPRRRRRGAGRPKRVPLEQAPVPASLASGERADLLIGLQEQISALSAAQLESSRIQKARVNKPGVVGGERQSSPAPSSRGSVIGSSGLSGSGLSGSGAVGSGAVGSGAVPADMSGMNGVIFAALQTLQSEIADRLGDSHKSLDNEKDKIIISLRETIGDRVKEIDELRAETATLRASLMKSSSEAAASKAEGVLLRQSLEEAKVKQDTWYKSSADATLALAEVHKGFLVHLGTHHGEAKRGEYQGDGNSQKGNHTHWPQ
jgi:hypothetical protein